MVHKERVDYVQCHYFTYVLMNNEKEGETTTSCRGPLALALDTGSQRFPRLTENESLSSLILG